MNESAKCSICGRDISDTKKVLLRRERYYGIVLSEKRMDYTLCDSCFKEIADHIRTMIIKKKKEVKDEKA